jgi:DNA polymerase III subunit delta
MTLTPDALLDQLAKKAPAPAYLFLGPEQYGRDLCKRAIAERVVASGDFENGVSKHDLEDSTLAEVLDDARAFSLFAPERVLSVSRAEGALPRGRAAAKDDDDDDAPKQKGGEAELAAYLASPTPGVAVVFDCSRYEFDGEDKAKVERVRKFYAGVPIFVEFAKLAPAQVRTLAAKRAKELELSIGAAELDTLVEATGASALACVNEIEKLSLHAGSRPVTIADIETMVPQARTTTIFALVNALGRKDRTQALDLLDVLLREGEYLPLALSFLATQFRQALVAHESQLRTAGQVQGHFSKLGVAMWPSRAEQVCGTVRMFSAEKLAKAIQLIAQTDKDLRDIRPDDRVVMERFVIALTA